MRAAIHGGSFIEKGKPWQNLIEAQFKIQLRIADFKFEQAQTVEEVQNFHAEFVDVFNTTAHYAHQERNDNRSCGRVQPHE